MTKSLASFSSRSFDKRMRDIEIVSINSLLSAFLIKNIVGIIMISLSFNFRLAQGNKIL